jgi:hypothetical protein
LKPKKERQVKQINLKINKKKNKEKQQELIW